MEALAFDYWGAHPSPSDTPIFAGLDRFGAARAVKTLGQAARLPVPLHPHLLRHTFVSQLLAAGVPVREVQHLAGHASLQTTQRYADALQHSQRHVSRILRRRFASATSTPPASARGVSSAGRDGFPDARGTRDSPRR